MFLLGEMIGLKWFQSLFGCSSFLMLFPLLLEILTFDFHIYQNYCQNLLHFFLMIPSFGDYLLILHVPNEKEILSKYSKYWLLANIPARDPPLKLDACPRPLLPKFALDAALFWGLENPVLLDPDLDPNPPDEAPYPPSPAHCPWERVAQAWYDQGLRGCRWD